MLLKDVLVKTQKDLYRPKNVYLKTVLCQ